MKYFCQDRPPWAPAPLPSCPHGEKAFLNLQPLWHSSTWCPPGPRTFSPELHPAPSVALSGLCLPKARLHSCPAPGAWHTVRPFFTPISVPLDSSPAPARTPQVSECSVRLKPFSSHRSSEVLVPRERKHYLPWIHRGSGLKEIHFQTEEWKTVKLWFTSLLTSDLQGVTSNSWGLWANQFIIINWNRSIGIPTAIRTSGLTEQMHTKHKQQ